MIDVDDFPKDLDFTDAWLMEISIDHAMVHLQIEALNLRRSAEASHAEYDKLDIFLSDLQSIDIQLKIPRIGPSDDDICSLHDLTVSQSTDSCLLEVSLEYGLLNLSARTCRVQQASLPEV